MGWQNHSFPGQVHDGARQLQHAMIGPLTQIHLLHRSAHQVLPCLIPFTEQQCTPDDPVAANPFALKLLLEVRLHME